MRLDALVDEEVVLRNIHTGEVKQIGQRELVEAIFSGAVKHPEKSTIDFGEAADLSRTTISRINARQESVKAVQHMVDKRAWVQALQEKGIDRIVDELHVRVAIEQLSLGKLAKVRRFSIATLAKTTRQIHKAQGDWSQIVPQFSGRGGAGDTRTDPRAEEVIKTILEGWKEGKNKVVKEKIYAAVKDTINTLNLGLPNNPITVPGHTTMSRRIPLHFSQKEIHIRNHGLDSAARKYRQNSYSRDSAEYPLLISEYDDMDSGVFLIDDGNGLPFGRGHLTHGICQNTLVPLGFDLSHKARSFDSAMGAICDSFLPKDTTRAEFIDCKLPWIGYGVQGSILLDNAKYNFSKSMNFGATEQTLALCGVKPYGPTEKSCIEHFNWVTKYDFCSELPGWRGDKLDPDGVKNGICGAIFTVEAFRLAYVRWVTGVYLNKPGDDGWTPKQRWQKHFVTHGPAIRWTPEQVAFFRLRPSMLKFRASGGVLRFGLTYNSDELIRWCDDLGKTGEILVFSNCRDLTYLLAKHPRTKELIRVPCTTDHKHVRGLTEHQQQLILKMARDRGNKNPQLRDMVEAREDLRKLVSQATLSSKLRRRLFAARAGTLPAKDITVGTSERPSDQTQLAGTEAVDRVMTDLEWSITQLEQVELETVDSDWGGQ